MSIVCDVNKKVINLWKEYFDTNSEVLSPIVHPEMEGEGILFIGLNPSANLKANVRILTNSVHFQALEIKDINEFFKWRNYDEQYTNKAQKIETIMRLEYQYFQKFSDIARHSFGEQGRDRWDHVDLFFYRETNQKEFEKGLYEDGRLSDFAEKQLLLSNELIAATHPKVVVVVNSCARNIFVDRYKVNRWDENLGCHITDIDNNATPVFFTSMLTGQRALDNGSYERLKWHIKRTLNR